MAQRTRMDVVPLARALASEQRRGLGGRLEQFAAGVSVGTPVIDALEQTPGLLSPSTVLALRVAEQTGTLESTYSSLISPRAVNEAVELFERYRANQHRFSRVFLMSGLTWLMVMFLSTYIEPMLIDIIEEFGLGLGDLAPWATTWFDLKPFVGLGLIISMLVCAIGWWRARRRAKFIASVDRTENEVRNVLALLAQVLRCGRPAASAVATLARFHPSPKLRQRLARVNGLIDQGHDAWTALKEEGFVGAAKVESLRVAQTPHTHAWLLERFSQPSSKNLNRRDGNWGHGLATIVMCFVALVVACNVIAIFDLLSQSIGILA
ncbi:MAG: hypothetical protein AAGC97_10465 [Planctomycetota bacterium]